MNKQIIVPAVLALTLLAGPAIALAQSEPGWQNDQGQQQQHADREERNHRWNDRNARRDERNGDDEDRDDDNRGGRGRWNGQNGNGGYNGNGRYGNQNNARQLSGIVSSFSAYNMQLNNGQRVVLHQGTIINPTGTTLQPGMRVAIYGHGNNDGSFEADQINVIGNGYSNTGGYGVGGNILTNVLGRLGL